MKELEQLVRKNILNMKPRTENKPSAKTEAHIFLDANENPYNEPYNRYPDPMQAKLKNKLSHIKRVYPDCIFLGNSSDEAVDLIYRCFAEPRQDNVVAIEPTRSLYHTYAEINDVEYRSVMLSADFQLSADSILYRCDANTKVVWLCSPNDPTGNELQREAIMAVIELFDGIVVVDEAYADFSKSPSLRQELHNLPNVIILDSFSHAWGCASLGTSMAFAHPEIIDLLNKVKYTHNISTEIQHKIYDQLSKMYEADKWRNILLMERDRLMDAFRLLPCCEKVYPTDANFFLARMTDADAIYSYLRERGILVKNVSREELCDGCLRITVGSKTENSELLSILRQINI